MTIEMRVRGLHYHQWLEDTDGVPFGVEVLGYDGTGQSMQAASFMLGLAAGAGSSTSTSPKTLAAVMCELHDGSTVDGAAVDLTRTANITAALSAKYSRKGTDASTYSGAAVRAEIGDQATAAQAAVLAVIGGDGGATSAVAAFGVDWESSLAASRFNFGLDLEGPAAHDGYFIPRYNSGFIRMGGRVQDAAGALVTVADIVVIAGTAAATDGVAGTGAGVAGPGSLYIRQDGANSTLRINTNTLASPTWSAIP